MSVINVRQLFTIPLGEGKLLEIRKADFTVIEDDAGLLARGLTGAAIWDSESKAGPGEYVVELEPEREVAAVYDNKGKEIKPARVFAPRLMLKGAGTALWT